MNKIIWLILVVVVVGLGAWYYFSNTSSEINMPITEEVVLENIAEEESSETANLKEFTVVGKNFSFLPATLTVKKGDRVKIILQNTGGVHDLTIDEFGVATKRINSGEQGVIEFTADQVGDFEYYCSVGEHRQMGMKGALTVEE